MAAVAAFHDVDPTRCFRCGVIARTERAHIIDRAFGGLDDVQNLIPLCFRCHRDQPIFANGEERRAWVWLTSPTDFDYFAAIASIDPGDLWIFNPPLYTEQRAGRRVDLIGAVGKAAPVGPTGQPGPGRPTAGEVGVPPSPASPAPHATTSAAGSEPVAADVA